MKQIQTQDSGYDRIIKEIDDLKAHYFTTAESIRSYIAGEAKTGATSSGAIISDFGTKLAVETEKIQLLNLIKYLVEEEKAKVVA